MEKLVIRTLLVLAGVALTSLTLGMGMFGTGFVDEVGITGTISHLLLGTLAWSIITALLVAGTALIVFLWKEAK